MRQVLYKMHIVYNEVDILGKIQGGGYRSIDISKDYQGIQSVEELSSREVGRNMQEGDRITAFGFCKWCLFTIDNV